MKLLIILVALAGVLIFFQTPQAARAQGQGQGQGAAESPVGVIPEGDSEPQISDADLALVGSDCDINEAEASLLRTKGIVAVNIEAIKDHLLVGYDPAKVTLQQMVAAIRERMAGTDAVGQHMGGKKAMSRSCIARIIR